MRMEGSREFRIYCEEAGELRASVMPHAEAPCTGFVNILPRYAKLGSPAAITAAAPR